MNRPSARKDTITRRRILAEGLVQGVGFRPFVHRLAGEHGLAGLVSNDSRGVVIEVEGPAGRLAAFIDDLPRRKPPLAQIMRLAVGEIPSTGQTDFVIMPSREGGDIGACPPPDTATCPDCLSEMNDPADRRYGYPFINCTNCGPRYTIIRALPYDRPATTMAAFAMCPSCASEYSDPADRRFHAQPIACPECGPRLELRGADGRPMPGDPVTQAGARLKEGAVVAVKGLGGFHLACDARDALAVERLRRRKGRESRPLAVMVRDLETAGRLVELDRAGRDILASSPRPVVLAPMRPGHGLAPGVAPGLSTLGLMLPYTPLHHLLLAAGPPELVMTSGNPSDEPIAADNQEALERLGGVADFFLLHDRDIHARADDSVVLMALGQPRVVRRSRGFAPRPLRLEPAGPDILAVGAELKNVVCLARGSLAFLSPHIGDLKHPDGLIFHQRTSDRLIRLLGVAPRAVALDLHPDYLSSRAALDRPEPLKIRVQHHAAHVLAGLAESGLAGPALGLALDGAGHGPDGTVWGGELLLVGPDGFSRPGHLARFRLPGGDAAAREPWRAALGLLRLAHGADWAAHAPDHLAGKTADGGAILARMLDQGINSPWCSSAGRLFDGVAGLAGLRLTCGHEGQAAMELEAAAAAGEHGAYPMDLAVSATGGLELDPAPLVRACLADLAGRVPIPVVSARFHAGLTDGLTQLAEAARRRHGLDLIVLSGGCFMNVLLLERLTRRLKASGFRVINHRDAPANDGGICLGQALAARLALAADDPELWTAPRPGA